MSAGISRRALVAWFLADEAEAGEESASRSSPSSPPTPALRRAELPAGRIAWQQAQRAAAAALPEGPKVAVIATFNCLNAGADFCATCVERCPVPGAVRVEGRRVVVDPARCDGCGVCVPLCPAPGGAILLRPVAPAGRLA